MVNGRTLLKMHSNVSDTIGTNPVRKNISVKTKEHNLFLLFFQVFIVFFYIYEFNLRAWGLSSDITSRRIVVLVMLIIAIIKTLLQNKKFTFDVYQSGYFKYMKSSHAVASLQVSLYTQFSHL